MNTQNHELKLRPLTAGDLERVVEIDAQLVNRRRSGFFEKRLVAALAEPEYFIYVGCEAGGRLQGYLIARLLGGEYGQDSRIAVMDIIGVDPASQGAGIGRALLQSFKDILGRKKIPQIQTQSDWHRLDFLSFLAASGFALAPVHILEREVGYIDSRATADPVRMAPETEAGEKNYGSSSGDDFQALARDLVVCRSLNAADMPALIRIDKKVAGHDRTDYYRRKVKEVIDESGIRVSMVAELDGNIVGFTMARVDFGEFGRTEPVAVLDTIAVDPGYKHHLIGTALLSQLLANLTSLGLETIRTVVMPDHLDVLAFLLKNGFHPGQRLTFSCAV